MKKPELSEIIQLFNTIILPFYAVKRDLYIPTEDNRAENDAEHSWSLAFMAFILTPLIDSKLDTSKAVTYAIVHDLVEIYAGDTSVWAENTNQAAKGDLEAKSFQKIKANFSNYPHFIDCLTSYRQQADAEAKFIYALDKLHNWLTAYAGTEYYYKKLRKIRQKQALQKLAEMRPKAYTHPQIGKYFDELVQLFKDHPEHFYPDKLKV